MVFNPATIQTEFASMISWRQNPDTNGIQLVSPSTPTSGQYYNDVHPLLTINNIASVSPDFISIDSGAANASFTTWLGQKTNAAIVSLMNRWIGEKFKMRSGKTLMERKRLFNTSPSEVLDVDESRFVGFHIKPRKDENVIMKIHKIGLRLSAINPSLTIYLFHTDTPKTPSTISVNYDTAGDLKWFDTSWALSGVGSYFIGYKQDDLSGQSINGVRDYAPNSAGQTRHPIGKYFTAIAMSSESDASELWDLASTKYTQSTNFGINFQTSVACDYTDFFVEQKEVFREYIRLGVGLEILTHLAHNSSARTNRNQKTIDKDLLVFDINGDTQGKSSRLSNDFERAMNAIQFNYSGISKVCLPCRKQAVEWTSSR